MVKKQAPDNTPYG